MEYEETTKTKEKERKILLAETTFIMSMQIWCGVCVCVNVWGIFRACVSVLPSPISISLAHAKSFRQNFIMFLISTWSFFSRFHYALVSYKRERENRK